MYNMEFDFEMSELCESILGYFWNPCSIIDGFSVIFFSPRFIQQRTISRVVWFSSHMDKPFGENMLWAYYEMQPVKNIRKFT